MRLIVLLAVLHGLAFIDRTMIGGVLPLVRQSVAMTDAEAGWIVGTAFALPYGLTALTVAATRRGGSASTVWLAGGVLVWTLGSVATGLAGSFGALTAARATLGIGQGVFVPIAITSLFDGVAPAARGRALGLFQGGATLGRSSALLVVGSLLSLLGLGTAGDGMEGWRWLFVVTALPNILVLLALVSVKPAAAAPGSESSASPNWGALLPFFPVAIAPVLLAQAVLGWLPTLFVRERGFSTVHAALLTGIVTLIAAPSGPLIAGWLIGRYRIAERHMPALVLIALTVTLVPLAGMIWILPLGGAMASLVALLVTLGMASFGGLFGVQLLVAPSARVRVNGVFLALVTMVGVGLGPLITGTLTSMTKGGRLSLGEALLMTGGVAVALCALAVAGARRSFAREVMA